VWVRELELNDLRNVRSAGLELGPGLNVFLGCNAQGKTTLLEGVGLLARGRSFRTEDTRSLIRRGAPALRARGTATAEGRGTSLEIELGEAGRLLRVDGRTVPPREYHGRLEVVVYSTDRLRVVHGPMRERRLYLDRGASALWPAYRQVHREFERVLVQRNAALEARRRDLSAWTERFVDVGGRLRFRRAAYVARLADGLSRGYRPRGERYGVALVPDGAGLGEDGHRRQLARELEDSRGREQAAGRTLVGPHRDAVALTVDGEEASLHASSGQARSLLLALALATLAVYREERGDSAVALLDDLDSELDEERAALLCDEVAERGQALVTTAHPGWAEKMADRGRIFRVTAGTFSLGVS
jgi:DNA replication and repair protein RecF